MTCLYQVTYFESERNRQKGRQTDRLTGRQAGRQAGREAGRQAGRQTDRQTHCDTISLRTANRKLWTNPIGKVGEEGRGRGWRWIGEGC